MSIETTAKKVKMASMQLLSCSKNDRSNALNAIAKSLLDNTDLILKENKKDITYATKQGLSSALIDRLLLTKQSIKSISKSVSAIKKQPEVVGEIVEKYKRPNGLIVSKQRVPLGVVAMIFESRPNVIIDVAALAIKSGNAIILKGGKEAKYSNQILGKLVRESIKGFIPINSIIVLDSTSRENIKKLLKLNQYIDVVVPRGGEKLIHYVYDNAKMPVIAHYKGLCHTYVHKDAGIKKAVSICLNAKAHRTGVCNAMETLLLHKSIAKKVLNDLIPLYKKNNIEIRGCAKTKAISQNIKKASNSDWDTEYLDSILSIKIVDSLEEAITHIQKYGSNHTEAIISKDKNAVEKFQTLVDASCIIINASTRFNDGGELGLGAELGISTSKFHSYGPMGTREMTTTRFLVQGTGQIRK